MKTQFFKSSFFPLVATVLFSAVVISSCDKDDDVTPVNNNPYTISGNANGAQVVPSVTGTGTGTISGSYNPSTRLLTYNTGWTGLSGAPTTGGFYTGASGASGTVIGNSWSFDSTATATGTRSDTITLTSDQATQLLGGNWYYTYGTTTNPAGEVRGQISATR